MFNVQLLTLQTLLAFSLQRQPSTGLSPPSDEEIGHDGLDASGTKANTKEEWLDSSQLAELGHRLPFSRTSEAMAIEAHSLKLLYSHAHS
jgi:hypothetical protein